MAGVTTSVILPEQGKFFNFVVSMSFASGGEGMGWVNLYWIMVPQGPSSCVTFI